jgi:hypothetical protein
MTLVAAFASSALAGPLIPTCTPCNKTNDFCGLNYKTSITLATLDKVARTGWDATHSALDITISTKEDAPTILLFNANQYKDGFVQIEYRKDNDREIDAFVAPAGQECLVYGPASKKLKTDDFYEANVHI